MMKRMALGLLALLLLTACGCAALLPSRTEGQDVSFPFSAPTPPTASPQGDSTDFPEQPDDLPAFARPNGPTWLAPEFDARGRWSAQLDVWGDGSETLLLDMVGYDSVEVSTISLQLALSPSGAALSGELEYANPTGILLADVDPSDDFAELFIMASEEGPSYTTHIYRIHKDGTLAQTDALWGSIEDIDANGPYVQLRDILDILGTREATVWCAFSADSSLEVADPYWFFDDIYWNGELDWYILSVIKPLPVTLQDGSAFTEPVGARLALFATDGYSEVLFRDDQGREGSLAITLGQGDDFGTFINGASEYDYFEDLPYAG
ncbi:MAG: hypothetical protein LBN26_05315 [Christensenellaceae bacterium]|jgi:hypothetical protein|nr:hypothetical protein [Christensenellaceae bacterium]